MTDKEILQAMQQMLEPIRSDINGIKVILDTKIQRDINLLSEGHDAILERLPDPENIDALEARVTAAEAVVKLHSKDIENSTIIEEESAQADSSFLVSNLQKQ